MSAEPKRVTRTEVWVGWENQVVNSAYPLRRWLGGSNHSAVFLTEYRPAGITQAAIKLVPADTLETEAQLVQWGTAATLNHPHLIRLFDVGRCHIGGRVYLYVVMEYADQTLAQLLPRRPLSPDEARDMLIPALSALNFLHRNGLVQGQVKPTNLLVVGDQLKLASDTIRSAGKLSSGILRASLHDPPELKDGEIGPAGDIWGLGVTLVEALTQHPPSWPESKAETVSLTASIPPLFVDTVRRCLNGTPAARPTAGELEGQFNPAVHAHPITVVAAEEPVYEVATVSTASNDSTASGMAHQAPRGGVFVLGVTAVLVLGLAVWVSRTIFAGQIEPSAAAPAPAAVAQPAATAAVVEAPTASAEADAPGARPPVAADEERSERSGYAETDIARATSSADAATTGSSGIANEGSAGAESTVDAAPTGVAPAPSGVATATASVPSGRSGVATALASGFSSATPVAAGASATSSFASAAPNADLSAQSPDIVGSVLHQQLPDIPRNIREKIRGHVNVTVRVLVDPSGNVVGEFLENAGPSRYFARQAGDAAINWKFVPTDARGPRVWMLKFEFTRAGTTVRTLGTQ
jgi:outer membrane biosynthesis protein TonB